MFRLSTGTFFIGGFLASIISLFVPRMTIIYGLDYGRALLIQFAFHSSYLLFAVPVAHTIMRVGYMRAAAAGLGIMGAACAMFLAAHGLRSYALVLLSLLALSAGTTFLQIAGNNVIAVVGQATGAAYRLNLLQAFNSIGTVIGPLVAARYVLGDVRSTGAGAVGAIAPPFLFAILLLFSLTLLFLIKRDLLSEHEAADMRGTRFDWATLLGDRRLLAGTAAVFAYVGAEVTIGSLLVNYLALPQVMDVSPVTAARLVSLYWGGAMIGRLIGAFAMRHIPPARLLCLAGLSAATLTGIAASIAGPAGGGALIAVGLCNSIMYPTIYVLALPEQPQRATPAGTLLCMAVIGGAIIPMLTGVAADRMGLAASLGLPALCYLLVAAFAQVRGKEG